MSEWVWDMPLAFVLTGPWVILVLYYLKKGRRQAATFKFNIPLKLKTGWKAHLAFLPVLFQFMALLLMIVALARPQKTNTQIKKNLDGVDIFLVLDVSDSMLIEDMDPLSRIEAAKEVINNFVSGLSQDRVGLIVFSGESDTRVPLTWDYPVVLKALSEVQTSYYDPYMKKGTAIGVALLASVARLQVSKAKSQVVLFLTDGEDNVGVVSPQTAMGVVKQKGIKVYTIGVGSYSQWSRIPRTTRDFTGRKRTFYQTLKSQINEPLLKKIASETGGRYYRAHNKTALQSIFNEIGQLEKSPLEVKKWQWRQELFGRILLWAVVFYACSVLFSLTLFWRTV